MAEQNVFNLMQNDEIGLLWKKIYQLHQKTKIYLLTAEEISENGDALIQPLKEHRDAYDHIVRIFASTTKKVPEGYDYYSYIKGNLEKAYGHEYRAFFDTADWLAYNLRHNLRERINVIPYNKRNQLIPNCKETIKLLNQYPFEISNLRNDKDIVKESDSDETIKEYENLLRQLIKLYKEIDSV